MKARNPRWAIAAVIGEGFLGRLAFGMLSFAFPLLAYSLGLSLTQIGLLISLRSVAVLPFKPVAGWLADRIGIRSVYLGGSLMRTLAAALLLISGDFWSLLLVRLLQGVSAAGRDVASLGVVVRDARHSVAWAYSWYSSAKHVGGVAGAAVAGLIIAASGGTYQTLLVVVLLLSIPPLGAAWIGLREVPDEQPSADKAPATEPSAGELASTWMLLKTLAGPATVGMLVAASAYMVHGIFPVLATEYAGLSAGQAGVVYTLSAVVFLFTGPFFGWFSDRYGRVFGLAWRSAANIGSSALYMASPTFAGIALARSVDDSGKAAFRPAWASAIAEVADQDPQQRGRRIGALDTAVTVGEVIGPALAGFLWQTGGIVALFGVRIGIAVVAEIAAIRVFGELPQRLRPSSRLTAAAYLLPVAVALGGIAWLVNTAAWETRSVPHLALLAGLFGAGMVVSAIAGSAAARAQQRDAARRQQEELSNLRHDIRKSLTVIQGEVELILAQDGVPPADRQASSQSVVEEIGHIVTLLQHARDDATDNRNGPAPSQAVDVCENARVTRQL